MRISKILISLLLCVMAMTENLHAQWKGKWQAQLKNNDTFSIHEFYPVNERICWTSTINFGFNDSLWIYNASNTSTFYKTIDGGKTWERGTIPFKGTHLSNKIVALNDKVAWAIFAGICNKLFKTNDGGKTWVEMSTPLSQSESFLNDAHFWSSTSGILIGDPRDGYFEIYITLNAGQVWQRIPESAMSPILPDEIGLEMQFNVFGNSCYFRTSKGRIFASHDGGHHWTASATGLSMIYALAFSPDGIGIVANYNWNKQKQKFDDSTFKISRDSGKTWRDLKIDPLKKPQGACLDLKIIPPSNYIIASFHLSNGVTNNNANNGATYISRDLGKTWELISRLAPFAIAYASPTAIWGGMLNVHHDPNFPKIVKYEGLPLMAADSASIDTTTTDLSIESSLNMDEIIQVPLWQKPWFWLFILLIAASSIWFYTKQQRKRIIHEERQRIADEMHDDLGADLVRIKYMTENLKTQWDEKKKTPSVEDPLASLSTAAKDALDGMNEIIKDMNAKDELLTNVLVDFRVWSNNFCRDAGLKCQFDLPDNIPSDKIVSGKIQHNLFLVLKQALRNIAQHAQASQVIITIEYKEKLHLTIIDNGRGFDPSVVKGNNGLRTMHQRVERLGGVCRIQSTVGKGTTVFFNLPV